MKVPRLTEADYQAALGVVELEEGLWSVPSISERLETVDEPVLRVVSATGDARGLWFTCDCIGHFAGSRRFVCRHIKAVVARLRSDNQQTGT